jgi:hypothetical protein
MRDAATGLAPRKRLDGDVKIAPVTESRHPTAAKRLLLFPFITAPTSNEQTSTPTSRVPALVLEPLELLEPLDLLDPLPLTPLLLLRFDLRSASAMALHASTSDSLFLVENQPSESGLKVILVISFSAFLLLSLEAIAYLCLQLGDAEMTEGNRWAGKKDNRTKIPRPPLLMI